MRIRIASLSEQGARAHNEDELRHGATHNGQYAVLADGAGGHSRGAEAAQRAVASIERMLRDETMGFLPVNLSQMVRLAHAELLHHQGAARADARMHCTVVVLWIEPQAGHVLWAHVGDSRLYRIRHGRVDVVTQDDSVVEHMVRAGLITVEQSRQHPQKNQLVAALGIEGDVTPHTVARPVELLDGDAFLLCSDGWWEGFDTTALVAAMELSATPEAWLARMRAQIQARAVPRQDNFSAIAVWVGDPSEVTVLRLDDTMPKPRPAG